MKIWDMKTQKEVHSAQFLDGTYGLAWSPDGSQLAVSGWKRGSGVMLYNRKAELLHTLEPREAVAEALAFSPDGKWLAGGDHEAVRIWDVAKRTLQHTSFGHTAKISSVAFRQDSQQLASASWDNSVRIWNVATGKEISVLRGHAQHVNTVLYQADGGLLTAASDRTLRRWDPSYFQRTYRAHAAQFRFAPDGESIWGITRMRHHLNIDLRTHEVKDEWIKGTPNGVGYAESMSHEGRMACGLKTRLDIQSRANPHKWFSLTGAHQGNIHATAFHPDGIRLASSGEDNLIKLWHGDSGKLLQTMTGHNDTVHALAFSTDGRKLAGGARRGGVFVWDLGTGKLEHDFPPHADMVRSLAFSPDGAHLASTGFDQKLKIWSLADGKLLHSLLASGGIVEAVLYFPDGKRLATAGDDKTVRVWDTASMQEVLTLRGHTARIDGLAVSLDGKRLASRSGLDGTFRVWDASEPPPQLTGLGTRRPPDTKVAKDPVVSRDPPEVKNALLNVAHELRDTDPRDRVLVKSFCREYKLELKAGVAYTIDMKSTELDAYLRLEDDTRKQLAKDDDSGGNLDARLVFIPQRTGTYFLIATTFVPARGRYTLTVSEGATATKTDVKFEDKLIRARLSLKNKQWDEAADLFDQVVLASPGMRAQVVREYALAGARDHIPEFYGRLVKRSPNDRRLWLESAKTAAEVSLWPRAAADYARLVRYTEDDLFESLCLYLIVNDLPRFDKLNVGFMNRAEKKQVRPYLAARMFTLMPPTSGDDQKRIERVAEQELTAMEHRYAALTVQGALDVHAPAGMTKLKRNCGGVWRTTPTGRGTFCRGSGWPWRCKARANLKKRPRSWPWPWRNSTNGASRCRFRSRGPGSPRFICTIGWKPRCCAAKPRSCSRIDLALSRWTKISDRRSRTPDSCGQRRERYFCPLSPGTPGRGRGPG